MNCNGNSDLKIKLLDVSEQIVDMADALKEAEFLENDNESRRIKQWLRDTGELLENIIGVATDDDLAYARFMMGSISAMLGYLSKAEEMYKKAIGHWPDHIGILNELFDVLVLQRKHSDAKKVLDQIIEFGGVTPLVLRNRAGLLAERGKYLEAIQTLTYCLSLFPEDEETKKRFDALDIGHCKGQENKCKRDS